jgi:arabinogalactan oligomer / maltooligosaccharide transport system permease protein
MTMMARSDGSRTAGSFLGKSLSYFALLAFTLFALYPISQIITIALRPSDQLLSTSLGLIPKGATLANFRILLTETPFLRWLGNSTLIAFAVTLTGVALASTCGYALSRFRFLGRSTDRHLHRNGITFC